VTRVALVGGGVIGGGWAGRLVANGVDVVVYDPHADAERRVREMVENAERAWSRLTLAPRTAGSLAFADTLGSAVGEADVVQESAPEDEELKRQLLAEIAEAARADALVLSSTSGLLPSKLQAGMRRPDRFAVGHPFNPVYLLPLVEVVAGADTAPETVDRAAAFYGSVGMKPLVVRREVDGFVADRLLEALWREALWLVHDGVATTGEVDDAIRFGPGLRWAQMGTFLTYRLAGGEGDMRHFMSQFGPALQWPWTKLTDVPDLTDAFVDELATQSDAQAGPHSVRELERQRDDNLVAILQALRAERYGAGEVVHEHEAKLFEAAHARDGRQLDETRPLRLYATSVEASWVDYNGHMTESRYLDVFASATDAFLSHVGLDAAYLADGHSAYTVETHIRHLAEARANEPLVAETQVLGADEKRLHLFHTLSHGTTAVELATGEHLLLHVDTSRGRAVPMGEPLAGRVAAIAKAHDSLPRPDGAGRYVGQPRS
jgi:carnitine 3-dehydrogenase